MIRFFHVKILIKDIVPQTPEVVAASAKVAAAALAAETAGGGVAGGSSMTGNGAISVQACQERSKGNRVTGKRQKRTYKVQ